MDGARDRKLMSGARSQKSLFGKGDEYAEQSAPDPETGMHSIGRNRRPPASFVQ
jgi:hypothetical protein